MGEPVGAQRKGGQWPGREGGRAGGGRAPELRPHQPLFLELPDPGPRRLPGPPQLLMALEGPGPSSADDLPGGATFSHKSSLTCVIWS